MGFMSPRRAVDPAPESRGPVMRPVPGPEAAWAQSSLGRMLNRQRRLQRLDRLHPWLLDTALVVLVFLLNMPNMLADSPVGPSPQVGSRGHASNEVLYLFAVALVVPLWWRRRAPATVFFVISSVAIVEWSLQIWQYVGVSALIAISSLALHGSLRLLRWAVAFACAELVLAVTVLMPAARPMLSLFFLLGVVAAAVAIGLTVRIHRMYLAALEERAERLEVERDQRVRLTAAAERSRVAREMHDIVGHNLSVMVGLADGAAVLAAAREEESVETLRLLGDTGRQAMSELRRVLGVLREGSPAARELSPQPAIRDIDTLLTRVRAAGVAVSYRTTGALDVLGSGVQLTIYRIVQEALTNTLKHAGANAAAEVTIAVDDHGVRICVTDTGPPSGTAAAADPQPGAGGAAGHGVVGIRQRASLYGGSVTIGPRPGGRGWIVDVVLELTSTTVLAGSGDVRP
jgi:signal transduction histidine kinase